MSQKGVVPEVRTENGLIHKNNKIAVIPDHGSRDIEEGTLRNAIKSLGLSWKDFKKA